MYAYLFLFGEGRDARPAAFDRRFRIACDLYYIEHYSLMLDLKIAYGTVRNELLGGSGF